MKPEKRYIVRTFVMARSGEHALKKARRTLPDEAYLDDKWVEKQITDGKVVEGFTK